MNQFEQDLLKMADDINKIAAEINAVAEGMTDGATPWKRWFAWRPVTTIGGDRIWGQRCYCRTRFTIFKRYAGTEYATDFDLLKDRD